MAWQAFTQVQKVDNGLAAGPAGMQSADGQSEVAADDAFFGQLPNPPPGPAPPVGVMAPQARRPVTVPVGLPEKVRWASRESSQPLAPGSGDQFSHSVEPKSFVEC